MIQHRVYAEDSPAKAAETIFKHFEINQSCTIEGLLFDNSEVISKGDEVLKHLLKLDEQFNFHKSQDGRIRRKRLVPANSIGGTVAHKIFRFDKTTKDGKPVVRIWRIQ